jgi:hypothetical protein
LAQAQPLRFSKVDVWARWRLQIKALAQRQEPNPPFDQLVPQVQKARRGSAKAVDPPAEQFRYLARQQIGP